MKIGDFARLGRVSVRMLRHYDQLGLLVPDLVDPYSGHRVYRADQLSRLNRVVALKDLGFTLEQVGHLLTDEVTAEELRGMLRLRRAELAEEAKVTAARLLSVEHRLAIIDKEDTMSTQEFVVTSLPARRIAGRSVTLATPEEIGGVVGEMFGQVAGALARAGYRPDGACALYDGAESGLRVTVGFEYAGAAPADPDAAGFEVVDVPAAPVAVTGVHLGAMDTISASWQAMHQWLEANGYAPVGTCSEVYLVAGDDIDQSQWVTELRQPVVATG